MKSFICLFMFKEVVILKILFLYNIEFWWGVYIFKKYVCKYNYNGRMIYVFLRLNE